MASNPTNNRLDRIEEKLDQMKHHKEQKYNKDDQRGGDQTAPCLAAMRFS